VGARQESVKDPVSTITTLMNRRKDLFTDEFKPTVVDAFERRPENSKYGVISAFTQAAQQLAYDKRIKLEKFAGDLMLRPLQKVIME
jgi:hypothetical protein